MTATTRRRLVLAAVVAAAASAGIEPLRDAALGVRAPVDFARDFVATRALAAGDRGYAVDAARRNQEAARVGAPILPEHGGPYLPHPPPATVALLPLAPLAFPGAALAWLLVSLAALAWLAHGLASITAGDRPMPAARIAAVAAALLLWPPVLHNLEKGQWSILLAALMTAAWRAHARGRDTRAGVLIGAAASLKVMPAAVLPFFLARRPRSAATAALTAAAVALATLPLVGLTAWKIFVTTSRGNVDALETWYANTASLHGLFARLFVGGTYATPLIAAPALGHALQLISSLALVAVVAALTVRRRHDPDAAPALFTAWTILAVLLNPLAWSHSVVLLALPIALLIPGAARPRVTLPVAVVLLSIPKETLYHLAGPAPASPARALALSVHALGALLLLAAALRPAR